MKRKYKYEYTTMACPVEIRDRMRRYGQRFGVTMKDIASNAVLNFKDSGQWLAVRASSKKREYCAVGVTDDARQVAEDYCRILGVKMKNLLERAVPAWLEKREEAEK